MKPLLVATTNPAKLDEYRLLLRDYNLAPVSLREAGVDDHAPEETADTFAGNALLKARFYFARANLPHGDLDRPLADEVIRRMAGVEPARRGARLRAATALVYHEHGRIHER